MGRLTRDGPFMPIPVTAREGPTLVQQLDEILSSALPIPSVGIDQPPNVEPFVYRPVERGRRARSESPGSFRLPLRPATVPLVAPQATYNIGRSRRPPRHPQGRRETTFDEDIGPRPQQLPQQPPVSTQAPQGPQIDRVQQPPTQPFRRSFPTPTPVIVSKYFIYHRMIVTCTSCQPENLHARPPTAPAAFGSSDQREPQTWYLPDQRRRVSYLNICIPDHVVMCICSGHSSHLRRVISLQLVNRRLVSLKDRIFNMSPCPLVL